MGTLAASRKDGPQLAEPQLNATPLIDVLLVLLVMLIFTLPIATHAVKLNLPQGTDVLPSVIRPIVLVNVDFDGQLSWNGEPLDRAQLDRRLHQVAAASFQPRVKIVPDKRTRYEAVAQVLAAAQRAQVSRLEVAPIQF